MSTTSITVDSCAYQSWSRNWLRVLVIFTFWPSTILPTSWSAIPSFLAYAQDTNNNEPDVIGVTLCACQPTTYTFTLDFNLTCADQTVGNRTGILDDECFVSKVGPEDVLDEHPVAVSLIRILELNRYLQPLVQTPIVGDFRSGDTVQYTSILAVPNATWTNPDQIPHGLQLIVRGRNPYDQFIDNTWIILYDSQCGILPSLFTGDKAGWTILVSGRDVYILSTPRVYVAGVALVPFYSRSHGIVLVDWLH
jgi:hypothetical protein